jgi:hypothetical protein
VRAACGDTNNSMERKFFPNITNLASLPRDIAKKIPLISRPFGGEDNTHDQKINLLRFKMFDRLVQE